MRFKQIDFTNFKPFLGTERLEFDLDEENPITLVCAKNDVGKTAILDGIRFCLYGFEEDDEDEALDQCINRTAAVNGDGETSVTLFVSHDEQNYKIKRGHYFSDVSSPDDRSAEGEFMKIVVAPNTEEEDIFIDTDSDEHDFGDAEDFVTDLLPEDTVRFFMFDGDRIDAFARRLEDADPGIRDAIELILGIREIQNAIKDLKNIPIKDYRSAYNEASSEADDYKAKKDEHEETAEELEEIEEDLEELESEINELSEDLSRKRQELAQAEDLEELHTEYIKARVTLYGIDEVPNAENVLDDSTIEEIGESVVSKIEGIRLQQQDLYSDFGPAASVVAAKNLEDHIPEQETTIPEAIRKTLKSKLDECLVCGQSFGVDTEGIDGIDEGDEDCDLCGRPLRIGEDELIDIYNEVDQDATDDAIELSQRIDDALDLEDDFDLAKQSLTQQFETLDSQYTDLELRQEQLESRIARIDNELDNAMDETEREALRDRRDQLETRLERLLVRKGERQTDLKNTQAELKEIDSALDDMEGATEREKRYKRLMDTSEQARNVFKEAKNQIVDRQRRRVEEEASRLFLEMSNKSDVYNGLDIDKDYRLRIRVNGDIRDLSEQDPSQGARQIIAYAFNAAVARSTSWEAPFVIDTPTGRLDNEHKTNLFENLPEFGNQIVILYQPREMNEQDIVSFRDRDILANHYQITRESGSSVSRIEPLPDGEYTCGDE